MKTKFCAIRISKNYKEKVQQITKDNQITEKELIEFLIDQFSNIQLLKVKESQISNLKELINSKDKEIKQLNFLIKNITEKENEIIRLKSSNEEYKSDYLFMSQLLEELVMNVKKNVFSNKYTFSLFPIEYEEVQSILKKIK
ncbi:hypothetical protein [Aureivirga sp. CE67]|uniref:hypothetical protein n=1 Tax=Aureivirga sp. CE67 TaxID=1788983 RepID=UPI0018CB8D79|nr:hypothetical protein [Aureivirga sp. CE67]